MNDSATYTADEFLGIRLELPDAGRWTELNQGKTLDEVKEAIEGTLNQVGLTILSARPER